ncbi:MAG: hypothetical protein K9N46_15675 [Candidatus Marinimicrobia bacterium]|nr:hypothetical protein [Candidatus Neomarinimicrobiota bacterium]MCF7830372.1 hypothetical protein [Candidatus Neomarinimicrobiota bacterium]MCF7882170.1 hypothetical protein [Candidatus Neomarinimicrobiota bacterium]
MSNQALKYGNITIAYFIAIAMMLTSLNGQNLQRGHSHPDTGVHNGSIVMTLVHHFEIVPVATGLAVFVYDYHQRPIGVSDIRGVVTINSQSGKEGEFKLKPFVTYSKYARPHQMGEPKNGFFKKKSVDSLTNGVQYEKPATNRMLDNLLWGRYSLDNITRSKIKISVHITKLPSKREPEARFHETIALTALPKNLKEMLDSSMNSADTDTLQTESQK